jgi:hypothetical protein
VDVTTHSLWTMAHGMGFGALYLLACSGALVELYRITFPSQAEPTAAQERFLRLYLCAMVTLAWAATLTGTYVVYPWYRVVPPSGTTALSMYPQRLLLASPLTSGWHSLGMEWKEHVAWFTPISITMVAALFLRYGRNLRQFPLLRRTAIIFTLASFIGAGVAGFFGAMINKYAPIQGGVNIRWKADAK